MSQYGVCIVCCAERYQNARCNDKKILQSSLFLHASFCPYLYLEYKRESAFRKTETFMRKFSRAALRDELL